MKNKKTKPHQAILEVTIRLRRHPVLEYCWDLVGDPLPDVTSGVAGFQSIQEMFSDINFIEMLQSHLGKDAVPEAVVAYARKFEQGSRQSVPEDVVEMLRAKYGELFTDLRTTGNNRGKL